MIYNKILKFHVIKVEEVYFHLNNLFKNFEEQFNKIVNENEAGDTICILAKK